MALKGIDKPQRRGKAYVGAYVEPESKRKLVELANKGGLTVTQLLCSMIDKADSIVVAMMALPEEKHSTHQ